MAQLVGDLPGGQSGHVEDGRGGLAEVLRGDPGESFGAARVAEVYVRLLLSGSDYRKHRKLGLPGFNAQAMEQGQVAEQRLLNIATVAAPAEIALRLDLDDQAPVVTPQRLFLVNKQPVALCDSYYPADLVAAIPIAEHERIKGGVHAVIEDPNAPDPTTSDAISGRLRRPHADRRG